MRYMAAIPHLTIQDGLCPRDLAELEPALSEDESRLLMGSSYPLRVLHGSRICTHCGTAWKVWTDAAGQPHVAHVGGTA